MANRWQVKIQNYLYPTVLYPRVLKNTVLYSDFTCCKSRFCFYSSVVDTAKHCGLASDFKIRCIFRKQKTVSLIKILWSHFPVLHAIGKNTQSPMILTDIKSKMCWGVRQLCLSSWDVYLPRNGTEVSFVPHVCFLLESTDLDFDEFI